MKTSNISLRFITPCFCAGADQNTAEIRPSAFRSQLRWWFRCLGGLEEEGLVFGSVAGKGNAGILQVRVHNLRLSDSWYQPKFTSPNEKEAYFNYLLTAPNREGFSRMWERVPDPIKKARGTIRRTSQIPPGSECYLSIRFLRPFPSDAAKERLDLSLQCLINFGAIGYRATRGFGAFVSMNGVPLRSELEALLSKMEVRGFRGALPQGGSNDALVVLRQIEDKLKGDKKAGTGYRLNHKAKDKTPLGFSHDHDRQTSAVRFRPVAYSTKGGDTQFALLVYQAPDSVLGNSVKTNPTYRKSARIV